MNIQRIEDACDVNSCNAPGYARSEPPKTWSRNALVKTWQSDRSGPVLHVSWHRQKLNEWRRTVCALAHILAEV